MGLQELWFILIAVLFLGYFVLEGFDFGVGILMPVLGRGPDTPERDTRRRAVLNTIGPVWAVSYTHLTLPTSDLV